MWVLALVALVFFLQAVVLAEAFAVFMREAAGTLAAASLSFCQPYPSASFVLLRRNSRLTSIASILLLPLCRTQRSLQESASLRRLASSFCCRTFTNWQCHSSAVAPVCSPLQDAAKHAGIRVAAAAGFTRHGSSWQG